MIDKGKKVQENPMVRAARIKFGEVIELNTDRLRA